VRKVRNEFSDGFVRYARISTTTKTNSAKNIDLISPKLPCMTSDQCVTDLRIDMTPSPAKEIVMKRTKKENDEDEDPGRPSRVLRVRILV